MKFIFLANGLGEVAQGAAVAEYARARGVSCKFLNATSTCNKYAKEFGFDSVLLPSGKSQRELNRIINESIEEYQPEVIFCCNSKTTRGIFSPTRKIILNSLIVSLDSNWLFEDMPAYFDRFFVVFPPKIFESNRNYKITDKRVKPVGFIPSGYEFSRAEINSIRKEFCSSKEKLAFAYFGRGITFRDFLVDTLLDAVEQLNRDSLKLRVILLSDWYVREREDIISIKWLKSDIEFNKYLAAADCVVCHHGMPTLAKAILGKVPIISFVPDVSESIKKPSEVCEVEPFEELRVCISLPYSAKAERLKQTLNQILFTEKGTKIRKEQSKYLIKGEEVVLTEIRNMLQRGNCSKVI